MNMTTATITIRSGYKQTELGVIPEDWEVKKVGEICDFVVPGRNKPKNFDGDIPWITTPDIKGNVVTVSKRELYVSKEEAKKAGSKIVTKNSVVMSCVGDLGLVAMMPSPMLCNDLMTHPGETRLYASR
jgi:type I restriction enzyme, S subunit